MSGLSSIGGMPIASSNKGFEMPALSKGNKSKESSPELQKISEMIETKLFVMAKQMQSMEKELRQKDIQLLDLRRAVDSANSNTQTMLSTMSTTVQMTLQSIQTDQHYLNDRLKELQSQIEMGQAATATLVERHEELLLLTAEANDLPIPGKEKSDK